MIISVNWLKQFTEIDCSINELATLIGARLVEVEEVIDLGAKYQGILIAEVKKVESHPNADKLRVVLIDDGGKTDATRDKHGLVQIVCGAPNVREGLRVAWIPPGVTVPATYDAPNPLMLDTRELRGVVSNGMLASAKELAVGESHEGILEVDVDVQPGSAFADAYELNDYLLDIENKSLTHRPDCFGLIGFAREVAAIQGKQFQTPRWLLATKPELYPLDIDVEPLKILARIEADVSKRYELIAFDSVDASKPSPFAIQTWLSRVGIRPISAIVDVTNYLMYLTGQPLHAFDLDAVIAEHPKQKLEIVVREAKPGETLALLDGRTVELDSGDIVICSGETPIGLAGAMGGATTEITSDTKRVLLESATFDLYRLRTTQMRHAIYSEAITRFTKGQMPAQTAPVLASAARMLIDIVGARRVSDIIDEYPGREEQVPIRLRVEAINQLLGTDFSVETITDILRRVEVRVERDDQELVVTPPYWRADLRIAEDITEEVGRIHGFDEIVPQLPQRPFRAVSPSHVDTIRTRIREVLSRAGANEMLSYSFVHEKLLAAAGQDATQAYKLANAISPTLQYYRLSLTPSLLEKVHPNIKAGYGEFALFELSKTHSKSLAEDSAGVPSELPVLALTYARQDQKGDGAAFYHARRLLDYSAKLLGIELSYKPAKLDQKNQMLQPFALERSAFVCVKATEELVGVIGEYNATVRRKLKLPAYAAGFELLLDKLVKAADTTEPYTPLSRYPGTIRDVTLSVGKDVSFVELSDCVKKVLDEVTFETRLEPLGVYKNEKDAGHKHVTLRLHLTHHERTITAEEANQVVNRVADAANQQFRAQVV